VGIKQKLNETQVVHSVGIMKADAKTPQLSSAHVSAIPWLLHWVSALLVLFLLATSLASGLGITARFFPAAWMDWHLSAGVALLAVSIIRLKTSGPFKGLAQLFAFNRPDAKTVKSALLLVVFTVALSGLAIFQKPPFGRSGILFGYVPMPTLIRLDHALHNVIIDIHIVLSCIIAVLLMAHVIAGMQRVPVSGRSRLATMLWPWC
jgi:cytochrome b561